MINLNFLVSENDKVSIGALEARMLDFYGRTDDYTAFQSESRCDDLWGQVAKNIEDRLRSTDSIKILEVGAGRSGFHNVLRDKFSAQRHRIEYCVQDVTLQNREHLQRVSNRQFLGETPIELHEGNFDIIFHSFVLEHICMPGLTLEHLVGRLCSGGSMIFSCPNYAFPFYICPSVRHRTTAVQWLSNAKILWNSFFADREALLNTDPAIFYVPFRRDEDAVHLVSRPQIRGLLRRHGSCTTFQTRNKGLKAMVLNRFLQCHLEFTKVA